jgi:antitoxin ParD1/3/4
MTAANEDRNLFGYTTEELRRLVQEGLDSGPTVDGPSAMMELLAKQNARVKELRPRDEEG